MVFLYIYAWEMKELDVFFENSAYLLKKLAMGERCGRKKGTGGYLIPSGLFVCGPLAPGFAGVNPGKAGG